MQTREDCLQILRQDLGSKSFYPAAEHILNFLFALKKSELRFLPLSRLMRVVELKFGADFSQSDIFTISQYFCGERVALLSTKFEFIDHEDTCYEVSVSDAITAIKTGEYYHPEYGYRISNPEQSIHMFFVPSIYLKKHIDG
ncbi:hypothetical protein [Alteromonas confluentis]|uniref:Uncharacterized protein n=1 Tax=Alteromonas confluentis TaxID=1656094 RepID=A0A1E7ZAE4_9ALTE|nr:hypothetical protein [Alteromonas confluentis]OFC70421.1 hypothetical protein BFC18_14755 [Alteromonas confluentis]